MSSLIETLPFSDAKARLSSLMTSVVHDYQPKAVHRHHGKEEMFLVPHEVMLALVENVAFDPQVSVVPGEFVVRLPEGTAPSVAVSPTTKRVTSPLF